MMVPGGVRGEREPQVAQSKAALRLAALRERVLARAAAAKGGP